RVAEDGDVAEVEARGVQLGELVDGRGDVVERGGPATALTPAEAAVLDVPHRDAAPRQVHRHGLPEALAVARLPAAAVAREPHREGAVGLRKVEVGTLAAVRPVAMPLGADQENVAYELGGAGNGGTVGGLRWVA